LNNLFEFPLQRDRLYEQVADQMLELISSESLRPGDKLPGERELAEQLQVSRTVVREAIRSLSVRGVIEVKPGCGSFIRELSSSDVANSISLLLQLRRDKGSLGELYEIRRMIEVEVAGLAALRATENDFAVLKATIEGMQSHVGDPEQLTRYDAEFHSVLAAAAHNELLTTLLRPITDLWTELIFASYYAPNAASDGISYHTKILQHVQNGDSERARAVMREHIDHSRQQIERVREQEADLRDSAV